MVYKVRTRKRNAPMLEMICMLGVLMVISILVLNLFIGANSLNHKARDVSKACILAENMAETIKGYQTLEEAVEYLKLQQIQDNHATAIYEKYYDKQWRVSKKPENYRVIVTVERQEVGKGRFYEIEILIKSEKKYPVIKNDTSNELVSLHVSSYK